MGQTISHRNLWHYVLYKWNNIWATWSSRRQSKTQADCTENVESTEHSVYMCRDRCETSTECENDRSVFEGNIRCQCVSQSMQWLNVYQTQTGHAMCLLASKQRAISFCGLNQNHCLSQYPAVLVHSHMAFLYSFSLWLTMFDCLKLSSFFFFLRETLSPLQRAFEMKPFGQQFERTRTVFKALFSSPLLLSFSHYILLSAWEWVDWTGGEGVGLWCFPCSHK